MSTLTGTAISKAISNVGLRNAMLLDWNSKLKGFYITVENGMMTLLGDGDDNIAQIYIGKHVPDTDGFLDTVSARLFRLIGQSALELAIDGDYMIVSEKTKRSRSITRIKIAI